ncbi:MAG: hypothetical protein IPN53_22255 [Comamonadaceae bacterium]|nr:hypothetical protein [Comamonadaceae bacterium]
MCVTATMRDGRSSSFVKSSPTDCNQPVNQSDKPGLSDGAKVAIGAAALLGIVALAHKSNDRNENQYNDERSVAEFERGYRDGMYHQGYHDYNRSQAYADGYNSGQQKRSSETSYRAPDGYHSGNASYFSVNDLVGSRATLVEGTMRDRGFKYATSSRSGSNTFTHWQNFQTRQCVEIVTANDEVLGVNNINFFSCR